MGVESYVSCEGSDLACSVLHMNAAASKQRRRDWFVSSIFVWAPVPRFLNDDGTWPFVVQGRALRSASAGFSLRHGGQPAWQPSAARRARRDSCQGVRFGGDPAGRDPIQEGALARRPEIVRLIPWDGVDQVSASLSVAKLKVKAWLSHA